jgi:aminopeptidase N
MSTRRSTTWLTEQAQADELVLTLPSEGYIAEQLDQVDPQAIHTVREAMRLQLALTLHADWEWVYETHRHNGAYRPDPLSSGRRALAGMALHHLCLAAVHAGDTLWPGKTLQAFKDASNMTDRFNALHALVNCGHPLAQQALDRFHALFKHEPLVLDKWFALQAAKCDVQGDVLPAVRQLLAHPDFSLLNPNRARSLIFSYCSANPGAFHRTDAGGDVLWRRGGFWFGGCDRPPARLSGLLLSFCFYEKYEVSSRNNIQNNGMYYCYLLQSQHLHYLAGQQFQILMIVPE